MNSLTKKGYCLNNTSSAKCKESDSSDSHDAGYSLLYNRPHYKQIVRIMKMTFILLTVTLMNVYSNGYSQKVSLSGKRVPLVDFFSTIKEQTGYVFFYDHELLKTAKPVSLKVENADLSQALILLFDDQPLDYTIENKTIVIGEKKMLETQSVLSDKLQDIRGKVVDSKGESLPGVSVLVKGTTNGTTTDIEGNFTLNVPDNSVLVFSYVGFESQEVAISGRQTINIVLKEDSQALNEVVVTALGISRDKKALAYSLTEVKGDSFTQARENNLGNALSGKVAGVNASSTSTGPGGSSRVIIRGNGSLSGDNQPLYVVNGVPINNSNNGTPGSSGGRDGGDGLVSINPDDIETLSVLKGGPAAALYGSRAANGVILITTKSGHAQKGLGVEYNSTYTAENVLTIPDWQYEYGSGSRGLKPASKSQAIVNGRTSWGAKLDGSMVINPDGIERPYSAQRDNNKNFYDTGTTFSNTVALNGGNETANFRFSVSDMDNNGVVPNSSMKRNTFSLNANANISKKILFEANAQYNIEVNKNRTSIADFTNNPNASVGLMGTNIDVRTLNPGYDDRGYEVEWNDYIFVTNPYFAVNKVKNEDQRRRIIGSFSTRYNITDFLYARARAGIDYFNRDSWNIGPTGQLTNLFGTYEKGRNTGFETNLEALLGFDKTFGKFTVTALAGGNKMYTQSAGTNLSSGNLNVPFNYFIANGASQNFNDNFSESAINSLFGSVDVGFNSYLYLSMTGRQDWFSTLSPESNTLFYPSLGLSFVLSDAWSSKPSWMDYAKIRTSWAQVGGGAPGAYGLDRLYTANSISHLGYPLMTSAGSTIPNNLKPYTSTTTEAGIEVRMLKNRLSADLTFYDKTTTNDIVSATTSSTSGYSAVRINVGEMRNRGVELLLSGSPVKSSNGLNWDVSYNMAYNENEVVKIADGLTSLAGGQPRTNNAYVNHYEGKPYGMISGFRVLKDANGNTVYNSANGLPFQSELTDLGRGVPPLTIGLSNNFGYKRFSLGFLLDGKFGAKIYSSTNAYGTNYGLDKRTVENGVRETGVSLTGVDQNGAPFSRVVPAQDYYQGIAFTITDQFIEDASFIKLRQLTLGYSLPASLLAKTPFQSASLSLVARNLWLIYSKAKNVDPESSYSISGSSYGLENFGVPPTRNYGVNLNVRF